MASSSAGPVTSRLTAPASRSRSASALASCTSTRAAAEHFWPAYAKAEATIPGTASSRSASASTITQFLPPISATTRLTWLCPGGVRAAASTISSPTAAEPVKAIVWTPGCRTSAAPTSPAPGSSATAPGGTPAARRIETSSPAQPGDCSAGFSSAALPVASAAAVIPAGMASGKFQGAITAVTPRAR